MRLADLFEEVGLTVAYHGTSAQRWSQTHGGIGELYLAVGLDGAIQYAREWEDEGEQPIVVEFKIKQLLGQKHLKLEPNWETIEHGGMDETATWQYSAIEFGTFCVAGFRNGDKTLGKIHYLNPSK